MKCKKHFLILCLIINMVNSLRPSGHNFWSFWFCSNGLLYLAEILQNTVENHANHTCCGQNVNIICVFCWLKKTQQDIRHNLHQERKIAIKKSFTSLDYCETQKTMNFRLSITLSNLIYPRKHGSQLSVRCEKSQLHAVNTDQFVLLSI